MKNKPRRAIVTGNNWAGKTYHFMKIGAKVEIIGSDIRGYNTVYKCKRKGLFAFLEPPQWVMDNDLKFL